MVPNKIFDIELHPQIFEIQMEILEYAKDIKAPAIVKVICKKNRMGDN